MTRTKLLVLIFLPVFSFCAIYLNWNQGPFDFSGPYFIGKMLIWLSFIAFSIYSGYCTFKEDLFDTVRGICQYHFGRQICLDLYLGAGLLLFVMFLNEPTFIGFLAWMIPTIFYVNLIGLLYFAIHFDSLVARFIV